jgi:C-terminal processing protease CtpA/Prc
LARRSRHLLACGDEDLITVIDDRFATSVGQAEFGSLMRRADGTIVRLEINRDGIRHSVAVTLKELLP